MKIRISFLTIIFVLMISQIFAQGTNNPKTSFAIIGGVNLQNLNGKDASGNKLKNDMIVGFHAGMNIQMPIAQQFYFQPGLMFSTKGAKNKGNILTSTYKLSYIELPLNFVYKADLGSGYFMLGFGPYIAYGVGGKATIKGGSATVESDIKFKKEVTMGDPLTTTYFKPFDAGGNIFFGYELAGGLFMQINAQLGLLSINPKYENISDSKSSIKNTGFGISIGYRF